MRIIDKYSNRTPVNYSVNGNILTVTAKNVLSYDLERLQASRPIDVNIKSDKAGYIFDDGYGDRMVMNIKVYPQSVQYVMQSEGEILYQEIVKTREFDVDEDVELTLWAFGPAAPLAKPVI